MSNRYLRLYSIRTMLSPLSHLLWVLILKPPLADAGCVVGQYYDGSVCKSCTELCSLSPENGRYKPCVGNCSKYLDDHSPVNKTILLCGRNSKKYFDDVSASCEMCYNCESGSACEDICQATFSCRKDSYFAVRSSSCETCRSLCYSARVRDELALCSKLCHHYLNELEKGEVYKLLCDLNTTGYYDFGTGCEICENHCDKYRKECEGYCNVSKENKTDVEKESNNPSPHIYGSSFIIWSVVIGYFLMILLVLYHYRAKFLGFLQKQFVKNPVQSEDHTTDHLNPDQQQETNI